MSSQDNRIPSWGVVIYLFIFYKCFKILFYLLFFKILGCIESSLRYASFSLRWLFLVVEHGL